MGQVLQGHFRKGEAEFVGFLPLLPDESGKEQTIQVKLKQPAHIYDVTEGKYLGRKKKFQFQLPSVDGKLFAFLPYLVKGLKVKPEERPVPGKEWAITLRLETQGNGSSPHPLTFKLFDARGKFREAYFQRLYIEPNKEVTVQVPLALNDTGAGWRIEVRDAISGKSGYYIFNLK